MYKKLEIKKILIDKDKKDIYKEWVNKIINFIKSWEVKNWDLFVINYRRKKIKFEILNLDKFLIQLKTKLPLSLFSFWNQEDIYLPSFIWNLLKDNIEFYFIIK